MGPFPLEDTVGMKLACCLLDRSLDPGNNEERIQFSTMRRMRYAYSNAYAAPHDMNGAAVIADGNQRVFASDGVRLVRFLVWDIHDRMSQADGRRGKAGSRPVY